MSEITPRQLRELAESGDVDPRDLEAALCTAADQLETVQATLAAIHAVEWVELPIEADSWARWGGQIDAILNADAT